ncbi:IscS subfamily cysteine desulfurase [soil metagenome]
MRRPIYLDYNATTPVDPSVVDAMRPFWEEHFGNPSSEHAYGWAAEEAVEQGRERVAEMIGCEARNVTFTSGATEAINLAIKGVAAADVGRNHVVTVATEHKAVLETCLSLEKAGHHLTVLGVDKNGLVDLEELREAVTEHTLLVAVMAVNSETGVIQPLREIADIAHAAGALMMTDATQAPGKMTVDVDAWGADLAAFSAHKLYGPKGVGALYRRLRSPRVRLVPQMDGGGHEGGLRSGTPNVPAIVGMGAAADLVRSRKDALGRVESLRDRMESELLARIEGAYVNGAGARRVGNTISLTFPGTRMRDVFPRMRGIAASTGSACQTTSVRPSHVLTAMGLPEDHAFSTVRLSLGRFTTEEEVETAIEEIVAAVEGAR